MKKVYLFSSVLALFLAACSGGEGTKHDHPYGMHTHDDGNVHENHQAADTLRQEEFEAPADSAYRPATDHGHSHDGDESTHQH